MGSLKALGSLDGKGRGLGERCCASLADLPPNSIPAPSSLLQARDTGAKLPALCNCHAADVFDPSYVWLCARNCPLYGRPQDFEHLLTSALIATGVL